MTDKELLELAAKAAGYFVTGWALPGCRTDGWVGAFLEREEETGDFQKWNPLTDDGDAFRLAVKLELDIFHSCISVQVIHRDNDMGTSIRCRGKHPQINDPLATTRRAIVRAAAEIGKEMK